MLFVVNADKEVTDIRMKGDLNKMHIPYLKDNEMFQELTKKLRC